MLDVQSPVIPVVGTLIREHPGTISLGQGVVHYGPPPLALARIADFPAQSNYHKYQAVEGIPALLEAFTAKLAQENGVRIGPDRRIVVTAGANMAFMNAICAITDPGDEVILPTPFYFNQEMAIVMANCRPVVAPTDENYRLDPAAIRRAMSDRTRAVVTVSPNNPTGAVYGEQALREVNEICRQRGVYHICDEAYEYFIFDGARHFSPGSLEGSTAHTISMYSMSKSYGMASWRIGFMVIPEVLFESVRKAQDTILICPPVICQEAAVGALRAGAGYCRQHLPAFEEIRARVKEQLHPLERFCTVPGAEGAFYFLLRLDTKAGPMELVERLIREFGVAVIPGTAFGMDSGCYLRVAYGALDQQTAAEGIGRLVRGLKAIFGH